MQTLVLVPTCHVYSESLSMVLLHPAKVRSMDTFLVSMLTQYCIDSRHNSQTTCKEAWFRLYRLWCNVSCSKLTTCHGIVFLVIQLLLSGHAQMSGSRSQCAPYVSSGTSSKVGQDSISCSWKSGAWQQGCQWCYSGIQNCTEYQSNCIQQECKRDTCWATTITGKRRCRSRMAWIFMEW